MPGMMPVAAAMEVTVHCPIDGRYSFYNSPYPSHRLSSGVDVYPDREYGEVAPSPVHGRVIQVRKVRAPRGRGFEAHPYDVVTVLESLENPGAVIKLLHVEPVIEDGEVIEPGQGLGRLLRSGYYGSGTSPHIHTEVRPPDDPLRARGGYTVQRLRGIEGAEPVEELVGVVTRSETGFTLVNLEGVSAPGLPADVGGVPGILDGGVPYYGWMGAHIDSHKPRGEVVRLCGTPIGVIKSHGRGVALADCLNFRVTVGEEPILGLSLRLAPRASSEIKLIPQRPGSLQLEVGAEVSIGVE